MPTCIICKKETEEISFRFGYGSQFDGADVCWGCAPDLDEAVKKLQAALDEHL